MRVRAERSDQEANSHVGSEEQEPEENIESPSSGNKQEPNAPLEIIGNPDDSDTLHTDTYSYSSSSQYGEGRRTCCLPPRRGRKVLTEEQARASHLNTSAKSQNLTIPLTNRS